MGNEPQVATPINALRRQPENVEANLMSYRGFQAMEKIANMLANSTIVPESFRNIVKVKDGYNQANRCWNYRDEENPSGISNCLVALNMANRLGADPLMVMQNLYLVDGRPSWSSQFIIAAINSCGRYSPLRFDVTGGEEIEVSYAVTEWVYNDRLKKKEPVDSDKTVKIKNFSCVAWAVEKGSNHRLESSPITMELAVKEGWYQKNGSKWQTMPEQMLRYRAAAFFGRIYAPELLMGLRSADEEQESIIIEHEPEIIPPKPVSVDELKKPRQPNKPVEQAQEVADEPELETVVVEEPEDKQPASTGGYVPTPEEQAEIKRREMAQAEERARFGEPVPVAVEQPTSRRGARGGTNYNVE